MVHTASIVYPSPASWLGIGRERFAGSPVPPTNTVPISGTYEPEDTPEFLRDTNLRAVQAGLFGETLGPQSSTFSFSGLSFLDTDGYWLDNVFGDLSTTSNGTLGTAQVLTNALSVGDTSLAVAVSLGAVVTGSVIQIADGAASEIVIATAGSTGTVVNFTGTPCRFPHTTSATAALQTAASNYSHTFAQLNSGSGQPPVHTLTDFTGITAGVGARSYASACVASLDFTGNAGEALSRSVSGLGFLSAPAASAPVANPTSAPPVANWRCTVSVGGTPVYSVGDWSCSLSRDLAVYFSAQGGLAPYVIARGNLSATFSLDYTVAVSEAPLAQLLSGGLTPLVLTLSNGLSGASALSITITASAAKTVAAKPVRGAEVIGFSTGWEAVANSTDVGGSGGLGPCTVTLVNAIATF